MRGSHRIISVISHLLQAELLMKWLVTIALFLTLAPTALAENSPMIIDKNMVQPEPVVVNHPAEKWSSTAFDSFANAPLVEHPTEKGTVVCRDPQVEFDETALRTSPSRKTMKEHMLVDILLHKRLLQKDKTYVDSLLGFRQDLPTGSYYDMIRPRGRVCGNAPNLLLEVVYDKDSKLVRYRSRYYKNCNAEPVDSQWIE